jgi:hypothetical protein
MFFESLFQPGKFCSTTSNKSGKEESRLTKVSMEPAPYDESFFPMNIFSSTSTGIIDEDVGINNDFFEDMQVNETTSSPPKPKPNFFSTATASILTALTSIVFGIFYLTKSSFRLVSFRTAKFGLVS